MANEPMPSATVVVIRDAERGVEVLLLERSAREGSGRGGPFVFPGGRFELADRSGGGEDVEQHARRAAVRETEEEAGLVLAADDLVPISRWITPDISPRRFDTWFFLTSIGRDAEVRVDGSEICDHRWIEPDQALSAYHRGEIRLAPPTFVTVNWLTGYTDAGSAREALRRQPVLTFRPCICRTPDGACILYPGDSGYESGEPERPGPRHRLSAGPDGWRYERS